MSAPFALPLLVERLADVLPDLNLELSTCYTLRWRGRWPWLIRHGRQLYVDLLQAADFFDATGKRKVAERLRTRAQRLHADLLKQRAIAASLKEAVGQ